MTQTELIAELRELVDDTKAPFLWSETRLRGFLSEGQDKFCEDTGLFVSFAPLALVVGQRDYAIPDRVIQVLDIFNNDRPLRRFQEGTFGWQETTDGVPTAWRADAATGVIRFNTKPAASQAGTELQLRLWRYSTIPLSANVDGFAATPELPDRLQRACVEWAAHKLLRFHDAEVEGAPKFDEHLRSYQEYVSEGKKWHRRHASLESNIVSNPAYMVVP